MRPEFHLHGVAALCLRKGMFVFVFVVVVIVPLAVAAAVDASSASPLFA